ncbi:putative enoyl-CoA hydratase echA8 [Pseudolycoriella hygida]|uniref:Enoyl-CoA hydratase echA8 n=1 Tax=Pseudolycoriella hygida TaxID=35572 RepID=A0A9Q0RUS5_9DIPT|nr:putative enoyl-CoA hydratase echA8 [Pseudolycoriella hygida]
MKNILLTGVLRPLRFIPQQWSSIGTTTRKMGSLSVKDFKSVRFFTKDRVAHIVLNRPNLLNAIDKHMPFEIQTAVQKANFDEEVHVILLYGAGDVFCAGYDLKSYAEEKPRDLEKQDDDIPDYVNQKMPWDPALDYQFMATVTNAYMEIWRSMKPVVAKIKRVAIGGGSDIALACDLTFMEKHSKIGYPPSVIWGCPTSAFWTFRVGMEKAKRILFTGELLTGEKAERIGLIGESVEGNEELDKRVDQVLQRLVTVPKNQLWYQKSVVNHVVEQQGLLSAQRLSIIYDGMSRHSPEGIQFQRRCMEIGFKKAVRERDSGKETIWSHMKRET